jgi:ribosome-associated translation inhibitor RaiA
MSTPLQITFRGMEPSPAVTRYVRARMDKLAAHFGRITACRVVIEEPNRHRLRGRHFHVRLDLTVPGGEIVVRHEPAARPPPADDGTPAPLPKNAEPDAPHKDAYLAIHDAFDIAHRKLEDRVRRQRKKSLHDAPPWRARKTGAAP